MFNFCDNTSRNATPQCFIPVRDATLPSRGVLGVQYELKALYLFANAKKVLSKCQAKAGGEKQQRQEQVRRGVSTHGESVNAEAAVSHGVVKGGLSPCVCVCVFLLVITPLLVAFDTHTHTYRASTMPLVLAARLFPSVHGNARSASDRCATLYRGRKILHQTGRVPGAWSTRRATNVCVILQISLQRLPPALHLLRFIIQSFPAKIQVHTGRNNNWALWSWRNRHSVL